MTSDIFVLDDPYFKHLNPNMLSSEFSDNFFIDSLSEMSDSIDNLLQGISSDEYKPNNSQISTQIPSNEPHFLDHIFPPSHQFESLSLTQQQEEQKTQTHLANLQTCRNLASGFGNHSVLEIESEDYILGLDSPNSYNSCSMQRSCRYSGNLLEEKPSFDGLLQAQKFQRMSSVENETNFSAAGQIRRVYSTGNLPEVKMKQMAEERASGGGERNFMEEASIKVGKYNPEERKERIDRYRAKRTQRNFNKTIKYACRKTLADSRPRIRGRFARNEEMGEVEGSLQEEEERILGKQGQEFLSNFGGTHFHYCAYS